MCGLTVDRTTWVPNVSITTLIVVGGVDSNLCNDPEHSYLCGRFSVQQSSFERA